MREPKVVEPVAEIVETPIVEEPVVEPVVEESKIEPVPEKVVEIVETQVEDVPKKTTKKKGFLRRIFRI